MEIGDHTIRHVKIIRWEDELIGPAIIRFYEPFGAHGCFDGAHGGRTDTANLFLRFT